jgi:hypothetical protein
MKRLCAALFFIAAYSAYSIDLAVIGYLPSLDNRVAGTNTVWNRFEGREEVEAMSVPVEVKCVVASFGSVALSIIGGYTFYVEDEFEGFTSHNVSLGCGFSTLRKEAGAQTGLVGFYTSVYPLYEFPVATYGKEPIAPWKIALDAGYGIDLGIEGGPYIYINLYARMIGAFKVKDGGGFRLNWPDIGIALGFHILQS